MAKSKWGGVEIRARTINLPSRSFFWRSSFYKIPQHLALEFLSRKNALRPMGTAQVLKKPIRQEESHENLKLRTRVAGYHQDLQSILRSKNNHSKRLSFSVKIKYPAGILAVYAG